HKRCKYAIQHENYTTLNAVHHSHGIFGNTCHVQEARPNFLYSTGVLHLSRLLQQVNMVASHLMVALFPAGLLAGLIPQQAPALADHCTVTTTLPPITITSLAPTSTVGSGQGGHDGIGMHTYTITYPHALLP
ncbi:hypothetical protein ACRALDRAFT_1091627, partial [Sodiomyces alcalophilus JCM 7366]|uniref:uncharacterized protein n=1 Tax=Sodiomyces alcalophilus JCM 7366 TaxID=591952 RepID=UPI0039B6078F